MTITLATTVADVARLTNRCTRTGPLGLVPTMGALHAGHASLIERAAQECAQVVVSVFVNPLQFDRVEDLETYPRALETDLALCQALGVNLVFAPPATEMYPEAPTTTVEPGRLALHLCGAHRPGHFRGVATVVTKLLQIVQPDRAYFGEKDAQQLAIIRRLVSDLNIPVEVVGVPTVREADGLALSSRNRRLSPEGRVKGAALYRALDTARREIAGGNRDPDSVRRRALENISQEADVTIEYVEIVDSRDMQPVAQIDREVIVAGALWVGPVRLIDNVRCGTPS